MTRHALNRLLGVFFFCFTNIRRISHHVSSLVIWRLDYYYSSPLAGLPFSWLSSDNFKRSRMLSQSLLYISLSSPTSTYCWAGFLHWLPVATCNRFNHRNSPTKSKIDLHLPKGTYQTPLCTGQLDKTLENQKTRIHARLFSVLANRWWNKTPQDVCGAESPAIFKWRTLHWALKRALKRNNDL